MASGSSNPYIQSMYAAAAANPYAALQAGAGGSGLLPLAGSTAAANPLAAGSTGNPLLDAYASQYAAQLAAAGVYTTQAGTGIEAQPGEEIT